MVSLLLRLLGTPSIDSHGLAIGDGDGLNFSESKQLSDEWTVSFTGKLTSDFTGFLLASLGDNAQANGEFISYLTGGSNNNFRLSDSNQIYDITAATAMKENKGTYNHYVLQKKNGKVTLFYNGTEVENVSLTNLFAIDTLFYSQMTVLQSMGSFKYALISNRAIAPENCDPEFYTKMNMVRCTIVCISVY